MDIMRTFGYLCPQCGMMVMGTRSQFALEVSNATVACECGKSQLQVKYDGKGYEVYVPCGLCGETHMAKCTPTRMLYGDIALSCAQSKQFSCFVGDEGSVEKNLRELAIVADKEKLQRESDNPTAFSDSVIMYEILSELKEIASRPNGISCACGGTDCAIAVGRSAVDITCARCGAKMRVPAATDDDLDALCCHMKLVIPIEV